jgi:hypothetical protein
MKILAWITGIFLGLVTLLGIAQTIASERIEVIELHTTDQHGESVTTRLWIVDHDGYQYLRVGSDGSGWFTRLRANNQVKVTRGDTTRTYRTQTRPDKSEVINLLMKDKYTWGDTFFATLFGAREGSIPIELHEV